MEYGVDMNAAAENGTTPLQLAERRDLTWPPRCAKMPRNRGNRLEYPAQQKRFTQ